ncbi:MAG: nuclear transport factor 2 family protein [Alphaproteobacteria bacterium]|jgi:hypothetical protein|nr:nuclear transport factor 2 family protein [Alphaproteobacteria bacterium]
MSERAAVLFANEVFYRAFADRDLAAMDAAWARRAPVVCIHPGWPPLEGREPVMESWRAILANPDSPSTQPRGAEAYLHGEAAFVVCYEEIEAQYLIATNIFVREDGLWRLVHHQAGPTSGEPPEEDEEAGRRTVN